jgi:hypothetical protein
MHLGYTKYCCFLFKWDNWHKKNHYVNKLWPKQTSLTRGEKIVLNPPLVLLEKIYLPPLHIKLGLTKNFVKGMDKTSRGFQYVRNTYPNVWRKNKEGIFIGTQFNNSSMKTWMKLKEMHGCHLRGFESTSLEITKQRTIRILCRTCWLRTNLRDAIWVWKSTFWSHTWIFFLKISAKLMTNTAKDFTKTLWLWKRGTKASGPQVCWQTIARHWRWMYLTPNTSESHMPLHLRGKFLPVSWAHKVLFCTFKFLYIFETLPDGKILYT